MSDTLMRDFVRDLPEGARKSLLQRHFGAWAHSGANHFGDRKSQAFSEEGA